MTIFLLTILAVARLFAYDAIWPLIVLNMFTLYLYLPSWFILIFSVWFQKRTIVVISFVIVIFHVYLIAADTQILQNIYRKPIYSSPQRSTGIRVMTANLLMINEKSDEMMREIKLFNPDIILLQEFSTQWLTSLRQAGIDLNYPYSTYLTREDSFGTAIYSRNPTFKGEIWYIDDIPMSRGSVIIGETMVKVYNIHTVPPRTLNYWRRWNYQVEILHAEFYNNRSATLVAGDFNLTMHSKWYKSLTTIMHGAHEACGRPLAVTWPNGMLPLPDIRLDHILLSSEFTCSSIKEGKGAGSDHKPIVADLVLSH